MRIMHWGFIEYERALHLQRDLVREVSAGAEEVLVLCEHPKTMTLGRAHRPENVLAPRTEFETRGFTVVSVDRGGDVTLHAPGQLVAYPLMDLKRRGRDIGAYLKKLEQTCVDFLRYFDIVANESGERARGVWVGDKKIASIGIGVSRWVTYHGIAINITTDLDLFRLVRPCGLDVAMTSVLKETGKAPQMSVAAKKFAGYFIQAFHDTDHSS
jgi:lipoyl(octanoyl) transferase